jgi:hypothetical protein
MLDSRVVDQDVERAERLLGQTHHLHDLIRLGHVGRRVDCSDAEFTFYVGAGFPNLLRIAITVDQHIDALRCESARNGEANSTGRAGNDRGLAQKAPSGGASI